MDSWEMSKQRIAEFQSSICAGCSMRSLRAALQLLCITVMAMTGSLSFTKKCVDFTNVIAQALCGGNKEVVEDGDTGRTRSQKLRVAAGPPSDRIFHALVKGISLGLGGVRNQGSCGVCKDRHSTGVYVTCSKGLDSSDSEPFWLCSAGVHGRQCYCQHLHEMLLSRS